MRAVRLAIRASREGAYAVQTCAGAGGAGEEMMR